MGFEYRPLDHFKRIEASAPGRVVLCGEFSELYGKTAIAIAVEKYLRVTILPYKAGRLRLNLNNYNDTREWPITSLPMTRFVIKHADVIDYSDRAFAKIRYLLHKRYNYSKTPKTLDTEIRIDEKSLKETEKSIESQVEDAILSFLILYLALSDSYANQMKPSIEVKVESQIPIGRGLGSSTAFGVALCGALMKLFRVTVEPCIISDWTLILERFFHGKSSRLNSCISIYGNYILYQQNKLKSLGCPMSPSIKLVIIDSETRKDPKKLNKMISDQLANNPQLTNTIFNQINELASQVWCKLNNPDFAPRSIATLLRANQSNLDLLGLGNPSLADICHAANQVRLAVKQIQGGQTALLLHDISDNFSFISFRNRISQLGYSLESNNISRTGLETRVVLETGSSG